MTQASEWTESRRGWLAEGLGLAVFFAFIGGFAASSALHYGFGREGVEASAAVLVIALINITASAFVVRRMWQILLPKDPGK